MAEDTSKEPDKKENRERKFSQEQYDMLKCCSEKKDMTEWNEWRDENYEQDIELESAEFSEFYLKGVNLATYREYGHKTPEVYLGRAKFNRSNLENANFQMAYMKGAEFHKAFMKGVRLDFAHLEGTLLLGADVRCATLIDVHLERANLCNANLSGSRLTDAHVEGTDIRNAQLQGSDFRMAFVDSTTSLFQCSVDRRTDFRGVGLDIARIDTKTKPLLEYNIRRMNWEDWYKERTKLKWLVKPFWWISDYGLSTSRIVATFFILAFVFAVVYRLYPSFVIVNEVVGDIRGFWHALYFSVVTMTTLGFGDIAANPDSWGGQTLLMLQVILGYVLLGALVTRFAVLFTAGGPAGKFADE
jgi:uncharacterized protein YjbI with pentapeptide repeats